MADTLRIRSNLPLAISATEPVPSEFADKPGLAPPLRSLLVKPGMNEFSGADVETYRKWASANPTFIADADAVKGGTTDGLVYEITGDEPDDEYGFEPALERATSGDNASLAAEGSTVKDAGPVKADDMAQKSAPNATVAIPAVVGPIGNVGSTGAAAAPIAAKK